MSFSQETSTPQWHIGAAIAAWVLPGLGHFVLGQRQRAAILCVTIGTLWLAGIIIGGVSVLDHRQHPAWFAGQMLMAPSVIVDQTIVHKLKPNAGIILTTPQPVYEPSFGRVNEQGILYTALAGLLNLLAIIDVLYQDTRLRENDRDKRPGPLHIAATSPDAPASANPASQPSHTVPSASSTSASSRAPAPAVPRETAVS